MTGNAARAHSCEAAIGESTSTWRASARRSGAARSSGHARGARPAKPSAPRPRASVWNRRGARSRTPTGAPGASVMRPASGTRTAAGKRHAAARNATAPTPDAPRSGGGRNRIARSATVPGGSVATPPRVATRRRWPRCGPGQRRRPPPGARRRKRATGTSSVRSPKRRRWVRVAGYRDARVRGEAPQGAQPVRPGAALTAAAASKPDPGQ